MNAAMVIFNTTVRQMNQGYCKKNNLLKKAT